MHLQTPWGYFVVKIVVVIMELGCPPNLKMEDVIWMDGLTSDLTQATKLCVFFSVLLKESKARQCDRIEL